MARPLVSVAAGLAAVSVASGATLLPAGSATVTRGNSLRGRRRLQEAMCNSIDCPNGYTPIHDAMTVECDDDPCQVSQCCEAFCLYHPCPNNFTPVFDAGTTMCPGSGCTDDLCCAEVEDDNYADNDTFTFTFAAADDDDNPTSAPRPSVTFATASSPV